VLRTQEQEEATIAETLEDVVVVGAGVIGLTTAVCLAEAGRQVLVLTAEPPHETTSVAAGAMSGLTITGPDDPATRWGAVATSVFLTLADQPGTGVHMMRGRLVSDLGDAPPPWAPDVPGYAACTGDELAGYRIGFWAELPFADMPRYLRYLQSRLEAAGGRVKLHPVARLSEAAAMAPVVANCTGVRARDLVPDPQVRSVKGQHVVVENPGLDTFLFEGGEASSWVGFFPYEDHVVLGGVAIEDDWDLTADPRISEQILTRCIAVEPRLADAQVLGTLVGLRPARPSVRLEEQPLGSARCIHCYGHGGAGVSLSWGCAREVADLILGQL
jgi:D-amino-acid oxidase